MKKLHIILLFTFFTTLAWSQKPIRLNWQVVDENLKPVSCATITPKHGFFFIPQEYIRGAVGGLDGQFTLDVMPGKDTIILRSLGMKTVEIPITQKTPLQWIETMIEDTIELKEVVVKGYKMIPDTTYCIHYLCKPTPAKPFKYDTIVQKESIRKTKIYPNPSSDFIFLQDQSSLGIVDVYALSGQQLERFNFTNQLNAQIDLSQWPAGTYILRSSAGWTELAVLQKR